MQLNVSRYATEEEREAGRIEGIKQKANAAILSIAPEWKQRNLTARGLELIETLASGGALTPDEQAESGAIKIVWSQIKTIRDASNQAEQAGTLAKNFNP